MHPGRRPEDAVAWDQQMERLAREPLHLLVPRHRVLRPSPWVHPSLPRHRTVALGWVGRRRGWSALARRQLAMDQVEGDESATGLVRDVQLDGVLRAAECSVRPER